MPEILVIMPFGRRTYLDGSDTRDVDFDHVYETIVRPAIQSSGKQALRIDELVGPGNISSQYLSRIVSAELVIVDLSMPNGNVYYELGIRQSLSNRPSILIAARATVLPFDVRNQRVLFYDLATAGDCELAVESLLRAIEGVADHSYANPVHQYLSNSGLIADPLNSADFERDLRGKIDRAATSEQLNAVWSWARGHPTLPPFTLLSLAEKFALIKDWEKASEIAQCACAARPDDYEIHRVLGWYLRNAGVAFYEQAEREFKDAIRLNPGDHEALGMLGGLLKRQGKYAEAARTYERGVKEAPRNLYLRAAHAGLELLVAPGSEQALQLYRDLLAVCGETDGLTDPWTLVVSGEAKFALGDDEGARTLFDRALALAESPTVLASPADQLDLFADAGFRPKEARALAAYLREQARRIGVRVVGQESRPAPEPSSGALPVIVHLSDPHFGYRREADGKRIPMHRFRDGDYSITLERHMLKELGISGGRLRVDPSRIIVVISGDVVYQAGQDEYEDALAFCRALVTGLSIPPKRMVFCPGNHDVNWADSKADRRRRFDNYLSFLRDFYGEDLFRKLYPRITWDFRVGSQRPPPEDIFGVSVFPDLGIEIYSFNSCVYETEQQHYGFVGGRQSRHAEELFADGVETPRVRIAVLHHHIHPYPEPVALDDEGAHWQDTSTVRDAGLFERFLERHKFDLVLHGHKHKPQLRETRVRDANSGEPTKSLIVCGAGSCGVESQELEHSEPNQYEIIEFLSGERMRHTDFLRVEWRELAVSPAAEWTTRHAWTLQG